MLRGLAQVGELAEVAYVLRYLSTADGSTVALNAAVPGRPDSQRVSEAISSIQ